VVALSSEWPKRKLREIGMEELRIPKFDYYLDESDPDEVTPSCLYSPNSW
jgi:hypothetical protein